MRCLGVFLFDRVFNGDINLHVAAAGLVIRLRGAGVDVDCGGIFDICVTALCCVFVALDINMHGASGFGMVVGVVFIVHIIALV